MKWKYNNEQIWLGQNNTSYYRRRHSTFALYGSRTNSTRNLDTGYSDKEIGNRGHRLTLDLNIRQSLHTWLQVLFAFFLFLAEDFGDATTFSFALTAAAAVSEWVFFRCLRWQLTLWRGSMMIIQLIRYQSDLYSTQWLEFQKQHPTGDLLSK